MYRGRSIFLMITIVAAAAIGEAVSEDKTKPETEKLSVWQRLFRQHASDYKIVMEGNEEGQIKLDAEPILNWSQPVRGGADGAVFVWTQEGRPMIIGTFFIWPSGNGKVGVAHELHSLSQLPLTAHWQDKAWTPPKDSITWTAISDAPVPGKTPEQRLRQMRDLARQFQAESQDKNDRKWELRLLPRPLYRQEKPNQQSAGPAPQEVLDGALFGFVEGTDLEVVLCLEAQRGNSNHQWKYSFARMSDFRLRASQGGKTVWEVDRSNYEETQQPYCCRTVEYRAFEEK